MLFDFFVIAVVVITDFDFYAARMNPNRMESKHCDFVTFMLDDVSISTL
jgi:hypothetical protein